MKRDRMLHEPRERLREIQNRALAAFISKKIYPFSPYYRKLFDQHRIDPGKIKTVEDLQRIPFSSKENLVPTTPDAKGILDFVLQPTEAFMKENLPLGDLLRLGIEKAVIGKAGFLEKLEREYKPIFVTATTGTTRAPVSFFYTEYDLERLKLYGRRAVSILNCGSRDRGVNLFPYAPHLAFWQVVFVGLAGGIFMFSTGGGKTFGTDANIQSLLKVRPDILIGTPEYVYHILKEAKAQNRKLEFIRKVVLGASRVPQGAKTKMTELLNAMGATDAHVFGTYGFTEARGAWTECPTPFGVSSGYHIYPDQEIFEVVHPDTGERVKEGEDGELVYTPLDARGSCVIRFRTGDLVKGGIQYGPCPHCGRTVPRISSDIVRASNVKNLQISKIKGVLVSLNFLEYLLDDEPAIDQWQIEILKKDNDPCEVDILDLYVHANEPINEEDFRRKINGKVSASSEITFNRITFVSAEEIKRRLEVESAVKAKKILDRRPHVA